jgi:hypothetical protein
LSAGNHWVCEKILFTAMAVFMRAYGILTHLAVRLWLITHAFTFYSPLNDQKVQRKYATDFWGVHPTNGFNWPSALFSSKLVADK